ncbi:nucleotide exchange factor GrpE [Tenggerimyces flavus]|uniref:Protein GrpE n=1 Tax=Tenggerimyces flavus TaxID=1708749 RepID=A0ABV7YIX1_9ACTN|nr:nucleotide exchange factor GrpE [Tenggerimyces flavus]MBM7784089.1 molecular chaperone GrpE [Tenggerimyces flavus]
MTQEGRDPEAGEQRGHVVHDRRRIDPKTGEARKVQGRGAPADAAAASGMTAGQPPVDAAGEAPAQVAELEQKLAERTADLQRLQAEYVNYKRRVDRDRDVNRELAVANVLTELLPVVDDIGRAREHEELQGGFKAVSEALETILGKLGLVRYGEVGDAFDPRIHEALMHAYSDEVDGPTCSAILQPGYRHGERVLRAARVAVVEPTVGLPPQAAAQPEAAPEAAETTEAAPEDLGDLGDILAGDDVTSESAEDEKK